MGYTGYTPFDNDNIQLILKKMEKSGLNELQLIIQNFQNNKSTRSLDICDNALAAAEIIACLTGNISEHMPEEIKENINLISNKTSSILVDDNMLSSMADIIDVIGADSELKTLWSDSIHSDKWYEYIKDIQSRILGAPLK